MIVNLKPILLVLLINLIFISGCASSDNIVNSQNENLNNKDNLNSLATHEQIDFLFIDNQFLISNIDNYFMVNGTSMQPTFFSGNKILVKKYNGDILKSGEIIVFKNKELGNLFNHILAHRVISDDGQVIITQGDNTYNQEKPLRSDVSYIVIGVIYE